MYSEEVDIETYQTGFQILSRYLKLIKKAEVKP